MAADVGVQVICPGCSRTVMQKAMIPVLGEGGQAMSYLCRDCARRSIAVDPAAPDSPA